MTVRRALLIGAALMSPMIPLRSSPLEDLASPSPEVRSHAAELIRANHLYRSTPRQPWDEFAATFKVGESEKAVIDRLHEVGLASLMPDDPSRRDNGVYRFRLDDSWVLLCAINEHTLT